MDIFSICTLCGGLAFFLFGMHVMSKSLEKVAGGKLESTLKKMTSNPVKSLALGAGITIAVQSSSALTVMLVGLVNSGIMQLEQTVGVIMGSNIGTTLTAWLLSTAGIKSDNIAVSMLKPENFAPIVALIGITMLMMSKKKKRQDIGTIMVGFAVLMYGMQLMKEAVSPLAETEGFSDMLIAFKNPILSVLIGALFTGIIQSSAASVGILQALAMTGAISYSMAIPIIMGQNIGTCVTALLSSIGVNKNAKRVTAVHMSFNIIGTIVCLALFYGANVLFHFSFVDKPIGAVEIAAVHSIFNILTTVMLLPFSNQLVKLARKLIPDSKEKEAEVLLDKRLLANPPLAASQCRERTKEMAVIAKEALHEALSAMFTYTQKGDYLFVQFGHNDRDYSKPERYVEPSQFSGYIQKFVDEGKKKGVNVILVSPMNLNGSRNVFSTGANNYDARGMMQKIATNSKIPFVDLNMKAYNLYNTTYKNIPDYVTRYLYKKLEKGE